MKIAICGSHGTGKSVLAEKLSRELNLPLIKEVAREFDIPNIKDIEQYIQIQKRILMSQIEREEKYQEFVSDRSVIDNFCYWISFCSKNASDEDNRWYLNTVVSHMRSYDRIIYLPVTDFSIEDNGFRFISKTVQQNIDDLIRCVLIMMRLDYETGEYPK